MLAHKARMHARLGWHTVGRLAPMLVALGWGAAMSLAQQAPAPSAADRPLVLAAEVDAIIHPISA